jgi:hypothetical protein
MNWTPARHRRAIACVLLAAEHLPFLRDWCRHHIAQGWDLVLYDNTGSVGSERLDAPEFHVGEVQREGRDKRDNHYGAWRAKLDDQQLRRRLLLAVAGLPVTVHEWRPRNCVGEIVHGQVEAYAEFVAAYRDTYDWAAFIDADEYLRAAHGRDWDELIDLAERSGCGSVMLDGLVLDARWTPDGRPRDRRLERTFGQQQGMKTLAKLDDVQRIDVHWVISRSPDTLHPPLGLYWFDHRNGSAADDVAIQRFALPADHPDSIGPPAVPRSLAALALPVMQRFGTADHDAGDDGLGQLLALLRQDAAATVTDWGRVRALAEAHRLGPAVWSAILERGSSPPPRSSADTAWARSAHERERERGATLEAVGAEATARLGAFGIEHAVLAGPRPLLRDRSRDTLTARGPILVVEPDARDIALAILADACWRIDPTAHDGDPTAPLLLAPPHPAGGNPVVSGAPARALWPLHPDQPAHEGPVATATTVAALALAAPEPGSGGVPLRALWELTVLAGDPLGVAIDWNTVRVAFAAAGAEPLLDDRLRLARRLFGADLPRPAKGDTPAASGDASPPVRGGRSHRRRDQDDRPESDANELREQPFRAFDAIFCLTPEPDSGQWAAIQARLERLGIGQRVQPLTVADGYAAYAAGWRETIAIAARRRYDQVLVLDHEAVFLDDTADVVYRAVTELRGRRWDLLFLGAAVFGMHFPFAPDASTLQRCGPVTGTFALAVHGRAFARLLAEIPPAGPQLDAWIERELAVSQYLSSELRSGRLDGLIVAPRVASQPALLRYDDADRALAKRYTIR